MLRTSLLSALLVSGSWNLARAQQPDPLQAEPLHLEPLHPVWAPAVAPLSMLAPGLGHTFRGDSKTGGQLLMTSGILLATGLAGAMGLGFSGAGDLPSGVLIPVTMVSVSSFLALGSADAIGAFSKFDPELSQHVFTDAWASRARAGVRYTFAPDPALDQAHLVHAFGEGRMGRWKFGAELASATSVDVLLAGGNASLLLLPIDEVHGAGLWLLAGVLHERNGPGEFTRLGGTLEASALLPLGSIWPSLAQMTTEIRLGVRPWRAQYGDGTARTDHLELTGGSELRWTATTWLRPYWGYDHARDGIVGGQGIGFFGSFYGGAELRLPQGFWLDARGSLGSPNTLRVSVERRW